MGRLWLQECLETIYQCVLRESRSGWGWKGLLEVIWSNCPAQTGSSAACGFAVERRVRDSLMLKYPDLLLPSVTFNAVYQALCRTNLPWKRAGWAVLALLISCSQISSERFLGALQNTVCVLAVWTWSLPCSCVLYYLFACIFLYSDLMVNLTV